MNNISLNPNGYMFAIVVALVSGHCICKFIDAKYDRNNNLNIDLTYKDVSASIHSSDSMVTV